MNTPYDSITMIFRKTNVQFNLCCFLLHHVLHLYFKNNCTVVANGEVNFNALFIEDAVIILESFV